MNKPDLKPCPFCGDEPYYEYIPPHEHFIVDLPPFEGGGIVECTSCCVGMTGRTLEDAIAKWNRRANDEPIVSSEHDEAVSKIVRRKMKDVQDT